MLPQLKKDVAGIMLALSAKKQLNFYGIAVSELLFSKCDLPVTGGAVKHGKRCFVLMKVLATAEPLWV